MTKTLPWTALALLIAVAELTAGPPGDPEAGPTLYVATNGNDAHSGRLPEPNAAGTDGPLATLARARDRLRELRAGQASDRPSRVVVRGGTYFFDEPLRLGPEDSGTAAGPVIFCAYPDEEVILSGGRPITGWARGEGDLPGAPFGTARCDATHPGTRFRSLREPEDRGVAPCTSER